MTENQEIPDIFKNISPRPTDSEANRLQEQADAVIRNLSKSYMENARVQLQNLERYAKEARQLSGAERSTLIRDFLFRTAHDMKGQGATFGYPLVTKLGARICDQIRHRDSWDNRDLDEIEADIGDIRTVMSFPPDTPNETFAEIERRINCIKEK